MLDERGDSPCEISKGRRSDELIGDRGTRVNRGNS